MKRNNIFDFDFNEIKKTTPYKDLLKTVKNFNAKKNTVDEDFFQVMANTTLSTMLIDCITKVDNHFKTIQAEMKRKTFKIVTNEKTGEK